MARILTPAEKRSFDGQGYVILRQVFDPQRVQALRAAVEGLVERALAGQVELRWIDQERGIPERISHLLHPDKFDPAYAQWLDQDLALHLEALVGPVRHSLFGMLAGGGGQPYLQGWHRDLGKPGDPDEEGFLRRFHGRSVQFNAPLLPGDHFLNIVPASHLRASTPAEIAASKAGDQAQMPEAMVVEVEPGDIVYYNANLWHRGWNPEGAMRWSLHCAYWRAEYPVMKHEHGQREAFLVPGHLERFPGQARALVQRYLDRYPAGEAPSCLDICQ
jgi:nicotinamide N-methyltransferase